MNPALSLLYEALTSRGEVDADPKLVGEALKLAYLNKVSLQFMRSIDLKGEAREAEERRLRDTVEVVEEIAKGFRDLDYAFYKLVKPVAYVPSDVDLLVKREHVRLAVSKLKGLGFEVEVAEPYCITMRSPKAIVDLYIHPTLGGMIYLDANRLLEHRAEARFHGLEIPSLKTYAEALATAAHALYKEIIYTLNDYVTVKSWADWRALKLAEELKCEPALKLAIELNEAMGRGDLSAPYKLPVALWARLMAHKLMVDGAARATCKNLLKVLIGRRGLEKLVSKLTRETY